MANLKEFLRSHDVAEADINKALDTGAQDKYDLAFLFTSEDRARYAGLLVPWALARGQGQAMAHHLAVRIAARDATPGRSGAGGSSTANGGYPREGHGRIPKAPPGRGFRVRFRPQGQRHAVGPEADASRRSAVVEQIMAEAMWVDPDERSAVKAVLQTFEHTVLAQRLRVWRKWVRFCVTNKKEHLRDTLGTVCRFLDSQRAVTAGGACWDSLRWMATHVKAPLGMPPRPPPAEVEGSHTGLRQAVAIEPEMVRRLELIIPTLLAEKSSLLGVALGAWVCIFGTVRFTHLQRARLIGRTPSAMHLFVYRGKSRLRGVRSGYILRCPRQAVANGCPADLLWTLWHRRKQTSKASFGLVFDHITGVPFSIAQFVRLAQQVFERAQAASNLDMLTTYSLRRFLPTAADVLMVPVSLRYSLGWSGPRGAAPSGMSCMPIRYSDQRGESEEMLKLALAIVTRDVLAAGLPGTSCTWEVLRKSGIKWDSHDVQQKIAAVMGGEMEWSVTATPSDRRATPRCFSIPARGERADRAQVPQVAVATPGGQEGFLAPAVRDGLPAAAPSSSALAGSGQGPGLQQIREQEVLWVISRNCVHLACSSGAGPLCRRAKRIVCRGQGLLKAMSFGYPVCRQCYTRAEASVRGLLDEQV